MIKQDQNGKNETTGTQKKDETQRDNLSASEQFNDSVDAREENKELERIEKLEKEVEELKNDYKRALADYQNLQKRTREERSDWIKSANKELVLRLLPVLDTMMLAQKHLKDQGLELSIRQFLDILKQEGIERIETLGKKFDPILMECIDIVEGSEEKVLDEIRAGYTMFEKVIRPAQVRVGRKGTS